MSIFSFKNLTTGTTKKINKTATGTEELQTWTFTFDTLPATLEQLQALDICDLKQPQNTAALTLLALCAFPDSREECFRMLDFLNGPKPLTTYEKQFLADRFMDGQNYIPYSYFEGADPDNSYTPNKPYTLVIKENPHSRDDLSIGYLTLYFTSGGSDTARHVKLRQKESTGEWFLYEQFLMVGIIRPSAEDPWA